jgi:periplasmic protein TonB
MATQIEIRATGLAGRGDPLGGGLAGALALHGAAAGLLVGWAFLTHSGQHWGERNATDGAIQATMVNAIPLPPKQPLNADNVLATDAPSPAPIAPAPRTVETPKPDAIPIPVKPVKPTKPVKTAEQTTPPPPLHPQPVKVDPTKATTGDAPGVRIAMSSTQTRLGTFSVGVTDTAFGTRFAYYNDQIKQKLESQWIVGMLDTQAAGHRVFITFQVARDGSPSHIQIAQRSGDATLDQTALSAVQHIDTFGPLPDGYQGTYVNVQYSFEAPPRP